ncbi:MAG: porin family protein [Alphaproteobacteria bacterium]|nr:porin family protein [Alphaproteobacteria bacterium]
MKTYIAAAVILASATTAQAQDEKHFDGAYLGGEIGYEDARGGVDGVYLGALAGYRVQKDSDLVFGIEGTFGKTFTDIEVIGDNFDGDYDHEWSIMGTVGKAFGAEKRSLIFLGAGFAQQKVTISTTNFSDSLTAETFAMALGYERAIGKNLSLRLRATTYEYKTVTGTFGLGYRF